MQLISTDILDVYILEPKIFEDNRGWFTESYSKREFEKSGLNYNFVQDNHSFSTNANILRGLHFQLGNDAQAKLVRCTRGVVFDVAVDLRIGSPTYLKWVAAELSENNKRQLLIPRGCAHAFLTLTDNVEFLYKTDNYYAPLSDRSIRWNDPQINIDWPLDNPILSEKDANAPFLCESDVNFIYGENC